MTLQDLGLPDELAGQISDGLEPARVIAEHKERYVISTGNKNYQAEITGNMRFSAQSREDFPAVGDWVKTSLFDDLAIITELLPRKNALARQAVGKFGEKQLIAANVDLAFLVQSAERDFNLNRLDRYISICNGASIEPIIVLSKIDLIDKAELENIRGLIAKRDRSLPVVFISNEDQRGFDDLRKFLKNGKTYCVLGSSGVGKSTLINNLLGTELMRTKTISESTGKGRHTTSHRELFVLDGGGVIIDTPGMRELGIAENKESLDLTFDKIAKLAAQCKFSDCTHSGEKGCAITDALENGLIDESELENYKKMLREQMRFEISVREKRENDRKRGKYFKQVKEHRKKDKF